MAVEFQDYSFKVKSTISDAMRSFLYGAAGEIEAQTKRNVDTSGRVDKGHTEGAWGYVVKDTAEGTEAVIGNPLENAIWDEFGTGEYALNNDGRRTPWFVPVKGYKGKKKPTYDGKVVIVYGKDGRQYYKTNGKKPIRAFTKAFNSLRPKIEKRAGQILQEELGK